MSKMIDELKTAGLPAPVFEENNGFRVNFSTTPQATPQAGDDLSKIQEKVLKFCKTPRTRAEIVKMTRLSLDYVRKELLPRLIERGKLVHTLPDTPNSPKQKYVSSGRKSPR